VVRISYVARIEIQITEIIHKIVKRIQRVAQQLFRWQIYIETPHQESHKICVQLIHPFINLPVKSLQIVQKLFTQKYYKSVQYPPMKPQPECASCVLRRAVFEAHLVDPSKAMDVVKGVLATLCEKFDENKPSIKVWTEVHRKVYEILGTEDPYREVKRKSNDIAMEMFPLALEYYEKSEDKLRAAEILSIAGNILDFGVSIKNPEDFQEKFQKILEEGIYHDDTDLLKKHLRGHVVYITDNCGEIVFDKLLIREIRKYADKITLLVRGKPILSDATLEDVYYVGLDREVDEIKTTGIFAVGIDMDIVPKEIRSLLSSADLIIAKGMGNYESLSETDLRPIAYLLRTKCDPVAREIGVPRDVNVVKFYG